MQRVAIFQVGDIHYPDHGGLDADVKDRSFPESLLEAATSRQLQNSVRELLARLAEEDEPVLIFSGDLTSRGDLVAYDKCVDFLNTALLLDDPDEWSSCRLHVVPGNHDVDRELAARQLPDDLVTKFEPLRDAWLARSLDIIATSNPRITEHASGSASLTLVGLNSCFGSGESRAIPPGTLTAIEQSLIGEGVEKEAIQRVLQQVQAAAETIDTPVFMASHIDEVEREVRRSGGRHLPVLIAHHNILQQALPRIDLYTDLVNAGMFRSRFTGLSVSVLYLHGHIHSDAIETIAQSSPDHGQLVSISCPEFVDGFNKIDVWFTDEGVPLGCSVHRYRTRLHGGFSAESPPVRISFLRGDASLSRLAREVAAALLQHPNMGLVADVQAKLDGSPSLDDVASAIKEVEWLGFVDILSPERSPKFWRLRVVNTDV